MIETCVNMATVALIVLTVVSIVRAAALPKGAPEKPNAILRLVCSLVGMAFILAFRYTRLSAWHYVIVGGALILILRELQNRPQACMSIYGNSRKRRLAAIVGSAIGLIVFIHSSWIVKLGLVGLAFVILIKKQNPRHVVRKAPERRTEEPSPVDGNTIQAASDVTNEADPDQLTASLAHPSTDMVHTETDGPSHPNDNVIRALSDATNEVDADQVTASYAHPTTGLAHTDAALQVYTSSEPGPAKSRARRIIIAGLTKTAAFKTEVNSLDEALKDIVITSAPDTLQDQLQVLPERLAQLAETEAERFDSIKQKLLTVLHIVQIIAEDQDKQSKVQATEILIKTMDAEQARTQDAETGRNHNGTADNPGSESNASS